MFPPVENPDINNGNITRKQGEDGSFVYTVWQVQILIVTENSKHQDDTLHELTVQKANTVIQINQSKYEHEFILEKHPKYVLGTADFPSESLEITHFSQPAQSTLKAFIK